MELGRLMVDYPAAAGTDANATLAAEVLAEAALFKVDIDAAVARSVVRNNSNGKIVFVPAAVTRGANNATPYADMTVSFSRLPAVLHRLQQSTACLFIILNK